MAHCWALGFSQGPTIRFIKGHLDEVRHPGVQSLQICAKLWRDQPAQGG